MTDELAERGGQRPIEHALAGGDPLAEQISRDFLELRYDEELPPAVRTTACCSPRMSASRLWVYQVDAQGIFYPFSSVFSGESSRVPKP